MPKLYPNDQKKVDQYLAKESQGGERKPFNPWLLLMVVLVVLGLITAAGYWVAFNHGVV